MSDPLAGEKTGRPQLLPEYAPPGLGPVDFWMERSNLAGIMIACVAYGEDLTPVPILIPTNMLNLILHRRFRHPVHPLRPMRLPTSQLGSRADEAGEDAEHLFLRAVGSGYAGNRRKYQVHPDDLHRLSELPWRTQRVHV